MRAVSSVGWIPFDLGEAARRRHRQKCSAAAKRSVLPSALGESVRRERTSPAPYKGVSLTPGKPPRLPGLHAQIYRRLPTGPAGGSTRRRRRRPPRSLTTRRRDLQRARRCYTVIGWYLQALQMCAAARNVSVVEEECRARGGAVCRYRLTWSNVVTGVTPLTPLAPLRSRRGGLR
jgi:hypothetical protein